MEKLKLKSGDKVLVFMPHPDDEAVFLSGTIRQLIKNEIIVKVVTVTRGEASTLRYGLKPTDSLAEAREKELVKVFKILGVTSFDIKSFKDGGLHTQINQLKKYLSQEINSFSPNMVITLEPDGIYGHSDHITLSDVVTSLIVPPCRLAYSTIAEYKHKPKASHMAIREVNPLKPNIIVKLGLIDKVTKIRCLRCHKTQFNFKKAQPGDYNFFKANRLLDFEYLVI
ncbi:PIG-L family deacetylase [Candidatus Shapirobacteria bacterium]|nr:PIG-L family deacetylase [Candidatus Shapirobacteria bacterium]